MGQLPGVTALKFTHFFAILASAERMTAKAFGEERVMEDGRLDGLSFGEAHFGTAQLGDPHGERSGLSSWPTGS